MGVKIVIENVQASDYSSILSGTTISCSDVDLQIRDAILSGDASLIKNLNVTEFCSELEDRISNMDPMSEEYHSLQTLFNNKKQPKKAFLQKLFKHMLSFSEGVAVNIVTALLTSK